MATAARRGGRRRARRESTIREDAPQAVQEGIDVSHHQRTVDWAQVAAAGIQFCFIKATQGATFVDPRFVENWNNAGRHALTRGAYHFFSPGVPIANQMKHFTGVVHLTDGDLAPVLDLEIDGQNWDVLPGTARVRAALEMLAALEEHYGVRPIVYTNKRTVAEVFGGKPGELASYPLWVASYRSAPPPTMPAGWSDWRFWQYTDQGTVAGVSTLVDRNRCIGSPGPLVKPRATELVAMEAVPDTALVGAAQGAERDHALLMFDRVWQRLTDNVRAGLFPQGVAEAKVEIAVEPSGRSTINVTVRTAARVEDPPNAGGVALSRSRKSKLTRARPPQRARGRSR